MRQILPFGPVVAILLVSANPVSAQTISGPATAIDGDSLTVSGISVRLNGIDAPEAKQTCDRAGVTWDCGEEAARQLRALVADAQVQCRTRGTDAYGRSLAVCNANGLELNRTMVATGWATAFRNYSQDYIADEQRAKVDRVGIWNSTFQLPQDYRHANEARSAPPRANAPQRLVGTRALAPAPMGRCAIKGNRNRKGQWIYHVPGMPYYEATRAEEVFCSEAAAEAAGYRRAIVR